jgi:hypothetical protein
MIPFEKIINSKIIVMILGTNNIHDKKVTPNLLKDALLELITTIQENLI